MRDSFTAWKELPLGLEFEEVADAADAEVRIAFADDGSWSYIGRQVLDQPANEPTMNFGWDLTTPYGRTTALHEIGHTLGLPHEHQNPFAGIVWNEQAVYDYFAGSPNFWPRDQTFHNVLRKLEPGRGPGLDLGPGLDHGVRLPGRADRPADRVPQRHPPARHAVAGRPGVGEDVVPGRGGRSRRSTG